MGYRVEEELAGVGATTAVGRTPGVTGAMTIDGGSVSDTTVEADMTRPSQATRGSAIAPSSVRDSRPQSFRRVRSCSTNPIELPAEAVEGTAVTLPATGTLTVHGVAQLVAVDLEARLLSSDRLVVGGSIPIAMSDYDITPPSAQRVVSIDENGTAELQLFFERGTGS